MSEMKLKLSQKNQKEKKRKKTRENSFLFKQYPVRNKKIRKFLAAYLDRYLSLLDYVSLARSLAGCFVAAICSFAVANERRVGLLLLSSLSAAFPHRNFLSTLIPRFFLVPFFWVAPVSDFTEVL
jgi:hypothetical protein